MAVLKGDIKRVTVSIPKSFLKDLDSHLKNFALTDRSRWLFEAAKEKLSQEKRRVGGWIKTSLDENVKKPERQGILSKKC